MKKIITIILTVILVATCSIAFTACNNTSSTDKLLLCSWCASDFSETFTYAVSGTDNNNTQVSGTLTMVIAPQDAGYSITLNQIMDNGDTVSGYVYFKSLGSSSAYVPSESVRTFTYASGSAVTQKVVYSTKAVDFYFENGTSITDNATHTSYEISSPYYDNMQFYTIIRGATFDKNFSLSFNAFLPNESQVVKLSCSLGSTESMSYYIKGVETSSDCQLVYITLNHTIANQYVKAYYATNDITLKNEYVVKHALVKFVEGNITYSLTNITATH